MMGFRIERFTPASRATIVVATFVAFALVAAPWLTGRANIRLLGEMFSFLALASLWNLLAGYCGLVSVGQQAFVGFGGYMLFALAIFLGMNPILAIVVAGVLGALIAAPVGVLIFRLQGPYFAIGSWVFAEILRLSFAQISALGGGSGSSLPTSVLAVIAGREWREIFIYWMGLTIAVAALLFVVLLLRSKTGLALAGLRDSEVASESLGVNAWLTKMKVYVSVAGLTTMVGAFIFLQKLRISPDAAFSVNDWTAYVIFIAVIGGVGTIEGPIVGPVVFFLLRETLSDFGTTYLMILGALAIVIMLKAPRGIWGIVSERAGISLVPIRRQVVFINESLAREREV